MSTVVRGEHPVCVTGLDFDDEEIYHGSYISELKRPTRSAGVLANVCGTQPIDEFSKAGPVPMREKRFVE